MLCTSGCGYNGKQNELCLWRVAGEVLHHTRRKTGVCWRNGPIQLLLARGQVLAKKLRQ